ncbi:MAG: group II intron maturase-specific domain-containing protein [Lysobacterales bacterium]
MARRKARSISPLLANWYLHDLDVRMGELESGDGSLCTDDFVILCRTAAEAAAALDEVRTWVATNGLQLHPTKTHIGNCLLPGQNWVSGLSLRSRAPLHPSQEPIQVQGPHPPTTRRLGSQSVERIISTLNPMLRGWLAYFKHAYHGIFPRLDGFIRRRLRALLRKQAKRPGHGHTAADHRRWPNAYFAQLGLHTLTTARGRASQSR